MSDEQQHEWALFNVEHHPTSRRISLRLVVEIAVIVAVLLLFALHGHAQTVTPNTVRITNPSSSPVNVTCISGCSGGGGNAAAGLTGSAVPTSAGYTGYNSAGNLVGVSTANPLPVAQQGTVTVSISGTPTVTVGNASLPVTQSGTWNVGQSGTWTVQPGNTANTTPWLVTLSGANSNVGVTQQTSPWVVSGTVTANQGGAPWSQNLTQYNSTNLTGTVTAYGTAPTGNVFGVNASVTNFPATQTVSGTVAATQSGTWNVNNTQQGTASQNVAQFGGASVVTGAGVGGAGIPRVTVSSDSFPTTQAVSGTVGLSAGTNNIGAVTVANLPAVQSVRLAPQLQPISVANQTPIYVVQLSNGSYVPVQLVEGQAVMSSSLPVVIASNQTAIPVSGTAAVTGVGSDNNSHALATDGAGNLYSRPLGLPLAPCNAVRTTNCQHF